MTSSTAVDTRARIVGAAALLLQEAGVAALTTRGVADAAGVQPPAIYRLFGDKDGLLDAVAEHVQATFVAAKAEVVGEAEGADLDPVADLRAGWRTYVEFGLANPTLFTLLSDPDRARTSPATAAGRALLHRRVRRVAAAGRLAVAEGTAADLLHAAGVGAVLTVLTAPAAERDPALTEVMLETVLHRVLTAAPDTAPGGGRGDRPEVTAAVALRAGLDGLRVLTASERQLLGDWLDRVIATP